VAEDQASVEENLCGACCLLAYSSGAVPLRSRYTCIALSVRSTFFVPGSDRLPERNPLRNNARFFRREIFPREQRN
jgi:hypothetical protein